MFFNFKKKAEANKESEKPVNLEPMYDDFKEEYSKAISANNSLLQLIYTANNNYKGKNILKAQKENREAINALIAEAINKNCEKNKEINEKYSI